MSAVKLMVLYPHPKDTVQFAADYSVHLQLFREKMKIPEHDSPYTVTKIFPSPEGPAKYHLIFSMPFDSIESLQQVMSTPEMQQVGMDANRILMLQKHGEFLR